MELRRKGLVGQGGAKIEMREVASTGFLTMKILFGANRDIASLAQEGPNAVSSGVMTRSKVLSSFQRTTVGKCTGFTVPTNIVRPQVGDYTKSKTARLSDAVIGAAVNS